MSNIVITEKNLSRFHKRLKKAIEQELGSTISLTTASQIFAQTFGAQNEHEFKTLLQKEEPIKNVSSSQEENKLKPLSTSKNSANEFLEADEIIQYIQNYFKNNNSTKINSFDLIKDENYLFLSISAPSQKYSYTLESFGLYFGDNNVEQSFEKERKNLVLNKEDELFIQDIIEKLQFKDIPKNIYFSEKLKKYISDNYSNMQSSFIFNLHQLENIVEIVNYGFVKKQFALIEKDFFEKNACPFVLNSDKYVDVSLKNHKVEIFDNFDQAFDSLNPNKILIDFLKPLDPQKYKNEIKGLSSYYLYFDNHVLKGSTMNGFQKKEIAHKNDYYYFLGKVYYNINNNHYQIKTNMPINEFHRKEILEGFRNCEIPPNKMVKKTK